MLVLPIYTSSSVKGQPNNAVGKAWWPPYDRENRVYGTPPIIAASVVVRGGPYRIGQSPKGGLAGSFLLDFYHRIHITPRRLDLGSVVSPQQANIKIWNAYLTPQPLTDIINDVDGALVTTPVAVGEQWPANAQLTAQVDVANEGEPSIDAQVVWVIGGDRVVLPVAALRIVAWPFMPNWIASPQETLAWATDILQAPTAKTQRRSLRDTPRRTVQFNYIEQKRERQIMDSLLAGWGSQEFAVPLSQDRQLFPQALPAGTQRINCHTAGYDYPPGQLVMIYISPYRWEAAEVSSVDPQGIDLARPTKQAWPKGAQLMPLRTARMAAQPDITRLTDQSSALSIRWAVVDKAVWPLAANAQEYRGRPVLHVRPNEVQDLTDTFKRLTLQLDNGTSPPLITDTGGQSFDLRGHRFSSTRAQHAVLLSLLYALRGRQKIVWRPTWADDLTITQNISASGSALVVQNIQYHNYLLGSSNRRDIAIFMRTGQVIYHRIVNAVPLSDDEELLTLDPPVVEGFSPSDVQQVSYLIPSTLASDTVSIEHITDDNREVNVVFEASADDI